MVGRGSRTQASRLPDTNDGRGHTRILIIEGRYYDDVCDALLEGAIAEIEAAGAAYDRITVPGALEIPQVLGQAINTGLLPDARYRGAVALGCVIRGETSHYDIVCNNANHWLMDVAMRHNVPLGNGILTVDTKAQALERARGGREGKGGDAARACMRLVEIAWQFQGQGA